MNQQKTVYFMYKLLSLIDSNKYLSIKDTKKYIENDTIFTELCNKFKIDIDTLNQDDKLKLIEMWQSHNNADLPEEVGIKNNGICLILAYMIQDIGVNDNE